MVIPSHLAIFGSSPLLPATAGAPTLRQLTISGPLPKAPDFRYGPPI